MAIVSAIGPTTPAMMVPTTKPTAIFTVNCT